MSSQEERVGRPFADPYLAGVGIGLVLLAAFVVTGRGLGASGGFASVVAAATAAVERPERAAQSAALAPYLTRGIASPLTDWLVLELVGVVIGGFVSAKLAGRSRLMVERGPNVGMRSRIVAAVAGGMFMGVGAKFARGCTSGQALTGGALLAAGSWIFIATCFASAYVLAPAARRLWR